MQPMGVDGKMALMGRLRLVGRAAWQAPALVVAP